MVDAPIDDSPVVEIPFEPSDGSEDEPVEPVASPPVTPPLVPPPLVPPVVSPVSPVAQPPRDAESVPEPGSMLGLGLAGAALMLSRRHRQRQSLRERRVAVPHFSQETSLR